MSTLEDLEQKGHNSENEAVDSEQKDLAVEHKQNSAEETRVVFKRYRAAGTFQQ